MDWFFRFLFSLLGLPLAPRLEALARTFLAAILTDLENNPEGLLDPDVEARLRNNCANHLMTAHALTAACIHARARQLAGLKLHRAQVSRLRRQNRLPTRTAIVRRAHELLRRLDRVEEIAAARAALLLEDPLRLAGFASDPPPPHPRWRKSPRPLSFFSSTTDAGEVDRAQGARDGGGLPRGPPLQPSSSAAA